MENSDHKTYLRKCEQCYSPTAIFETRCQLNWLEGVTYKQSQMHEMGDSSSLPWPLLDVEVVTMPVLCQLFSSCVLVKQHQRHWKLILLLLLVPKSHLTLCGNPRDCSLPAPLSVGFPRQEYWSLWEIFPTQELNLPLLLRRWILYCSPTWEAL